MKRCLLFVAVLALAVSPAQAGGSIGLFGGVLATEDADVSGGAGARLKFDAGKRWDLVMRASYYDELESDPTPEVYNIQATPWDFGGQYEIGGRGSSGRDRKSRAYLGGGLSYWTFDFRADTTPLAPPRGVDIDPEVGFYIDFGFEVPISKSAIFFGEIVGRLVDAEVEGDDLGLPLDQKVSMSGGSLHLGLAVTW